MAEIHRREFLTRSGSLGLGAAVGLTILKNPRSAQGLRRTKRSFSD